MLKKFQQAYNALQDGYPCRGLDLVASGLSLTENSSRSLTSFFTKAPTGEPSSSTQETLSATLETWECDKCKEEVLIRDIEEHTDYHFALEISQQDIPKRKASTHIAPFFLKRQK